MTSSESSGAGCLFHPGLGCGGESNREDRLTILDWGGVNVQGGDSPRLAIRVDVAQRPDMRDLRRVLLSETPQGQASSYAVWHLTRGVDAARSLVLVVVGAEPVRFHYSIVFPELDWPKLDAACQGGYVGLLSEDWTLLTWLDTAGMRDALAKVAALDSSAP